MFYWRNLLKSEEIIMKMLGFAFAVGLIVLYFLNIALLKHSKRAQWTVGSRLIYAF